MGIAIAVALGVYLVVAELTNKPAIPVVVSLCDLKPGTTFEDPASVACIELRSRDTLPPGGVIGSLEELRGKTVRIGVLTGEPIVLAKLGPADEGTVAVYVA